MIGWDAQLVCAGADAWFGGLDPYYVKNLIGTDLSYPYAPFTLPILASACPALSQHFSLIYWVVGTIAASIAFFTGKSHGLFKILMVFFGFGGLLWVCRTGNIAGFDGLLIALALFLMFRGKERFGSILLGLSLSIKLMMAPIILAFYFLPRKRLALSAYATAGLGVPLVLSAILQPHLMASWIDCILGRIPGQHWIFREGYAPSIYNWAQGPIFYVAIAVSILVVTLLRSQRSLPVFLTAAIAIILCEPRMKEYSYFELAIYVAAALNFLSTRWATAVLCMSLIGLLPFDYSQLMAEAGVFGILVYNSDRTVATS